MQNKIELNTTKQIRKHLSKRPQKGWSDLTASRGKEFAFQGSFVSADPERIHQWLHSRIHTANRSGVYRLMAKLIPGAPGILFQEGEEWQRSLQAVMPVFTRQNLEEYSSLLLKIATEHSRAWRNKGTTHDFYLDVTNMGLEMILEIGYGLDSKHPKVKEYGFALRDYKLATMYEGLRIDQFGFELAQLKGLPKFFRSLADLSKRMKRQSVLLQEMIEEDLVSSDRKNWVGLLMAAGLSGRKLSDELNHIYGAFNAIDYTLCCALCELSNKHEWREKLEKELRGAEPNALIEGRAYGQRFPNTQAFMKEVFRYYPVAIAVMRKAGEPFEAAGKKWKKGSEALLLIQSLHFDPEYWDEPWTFDPIRFQKDLKEPKAYIPFLGGSRKCIGQHLAELHFLHSLYAIAQEGFPQVDTSKFEIQPYIIPRLVNLLTAEHSSIPQDV